MNGKKRPRIGVMVGNYHSDHPRRLVKQIWKLLKDQEVDVRFYLGTESSSFLGGFGVQERKYDYQYCSLYPYSRYDDLDLLILSLGTMAIYHPPAELEQAMAYLPAVPMIRLEVVGEGSDCVIVDNAQGIRTCTEHLIKEHGCRDIAFVTGPENNVDADERYQSFVDTMRSHGLPVRTDRIVHGDFSEHIDRQLEVLFTSGDYPEAIVSSNDEMALSIYRVLAVHGLTPGKDVLVTGFDDMEMAAFMDPPLTTVRQDYEDMAAAAVERAWDLLRGGKPEVRRIPAKFVCRCSCGCNCSSLGDEAERDQLVGSVWQRRKNQQNSWIGALLSRELMEASNYKNFFYRLGTHFRFLDVRKANVYLLEEPVFLEKGEVLRPEAPLRRVLEHEGDRRVACAPTEGLLVPVDHNGLPEDRETKANCAMVFLLFFEHYQYGTLHVEIDPSECDFYYMMSLEIGSGLRYLNLSMEQKAFQSALQEKNQILDFTAHHDELTGIYNRTGTMTKSLELFRSMVPGTAFVVLVADLDHLKQINDTFGHDAGDDAIRTAANILSSVVKRKSDVLGRTGGDEFLAVFAVRPPFDLSAMIREIKEKCEAYNQTSNKPWYIGISAGGILFGAEDARDFSALVKKADEEMYEDKKTRRGSVIR